MASQPAIAENWQQVLKKVAAAKQTSRRQDQLIKIVAVSKKQSLQSILTAYDLGQRDFAENYLQEAIAKVKKINHPEIIWHFIGGIQTNKIKLIAEYFSWCQSVCRIKELEKLNAACQEKNKKLQVCFQVNIDNDPNKNGVTTVAELDDLIAAAEKCSHITIRGLMVLPMYHENLDAQKASFKKGEKLFLKIKQKDPCIDTLSMGMTHDIEAAIAAGSTMLRIGTALFGERLT